MNDPHYRRKPTSRKHKGYQIRLQPEWLGLMAFVALAEKRPTPIMAPDREAALVKAYEWIEAQLTAPDHAVTQKSDPPVGVKASDDQTDAYPAA